MPHASRAGVNAAPGMARLEARFPRSADIGKLNLDAFHIERDRARRRQATSSIGAFRPLALLLEADREQGQHLVALAAVEADRADGLAPA